MSLENFDPNKYPTTLDSMLSTILELCTQQHALLQVVVRNQATLANKIDPSVDFMEFLKESIQEVQDTTDELKPIIWSKL